MNLAEAFIEGTVACEVDGCTAIATTTLKDFGHLFGQGPYATDLVQVGPIHFFCNHQKRDSRSLRKVNGEWLPV